MKKLFMLLFLCASLITNAQDAKPTKEQTVEYIINTLQNYESNNEGERAELFFSTKYSIKEISFSGDKLYLKMYNYLSITDRKTDEYEKELPSQQRLLLREQRA